MLTVFGVKMSETTAWTRTTLAAGTRLGFSSRHWVWDRVMRNFSGLL